MPLDELRAELHRILENSKRWDGKVWNLQVVEATERTVQLRALMSAPDASTAWDLRCEVRERLIGFIQERFPDSLPRARAEIRGSLDTTERELLSDKDMGPGLLPSPRGEKSDIPPEPEPTRV